MQTNHQSLYIGTPNRGVDLFCNVAINGRHIFRMHSESFIGTFLQDVHGLIHGGRVKRFISPGDQYFHMSTLRGLRRTAEGDLELYFGTSTPFAGTNYTHGTDPDVTGNPMWIRIQDVSSVPKVNGQWKIKAAHTDGKYVVIEDFPQDIDITPFAWNSYDGRAVLRFFGRVATTTQYCQPFRDIVPTVGGSDAPVSIRAVQLGKPLDDILLLGSRSVSALVTDQEKSVFTISRPFTNDTGADVVIHELGLMSRPHDDQRHALKTAYNVYARDALDAPTFLPHGKTLTLDYECRFELENFNQDTDLHGSNGGFLQTFADYIRRQVTHSTETTPEAYMLAMGMGGGRANSDTDPAVRRTETAEGWRFGIRLGLSNKFVSMTDVELSPDATVETPYKQGGIPHGYGEGELVHHGMLIDDEVFFDDGSNAAYFTVSRIFENRGASPVTVKEVGLYGNGSASTSRELLPKLIARRALAPADQFTIAAGEMKKVSYKIKMIA